MSQHIDARPPPQALCSGCEATQEVELTSADFEDLPGLELGRQYKNAPITEAILEFQVRNPEGLTVDDLARSTLGDGATSASPLFTLQGEVSVVNGELLNDARSEQVGLAFARKDGTRVVQAALDRFSFIWNGSYEHWGAFSDEAEAAWLQYREVAQPEWVGVVGVRFVNRIPMPKPSIEIKDYLRTSVDVSPYLPQAVNSLFMQVEVPIPRLQAAATITSAMLTPAPGTTFDKVPLQLLLDIDVKAELNMATQEEGFNSSVTGILTRLRMAKNFVFEACITDATRGLID
ncbi:TIGR04255 family protein [Nocardioides cavernae]|uniref:TIGR04255 family protein n=1 Tax=Nocardioides cavernae TaxID=1921566 RepID=A0ABR8N985_9ACTN|nr:TIGR04255 family protein [Nocardioides cavernae]MBD3924699.1 TIGR04255 family protein [Nocardioides cavernae]MBM7514927.1 uncharacterized protein (TIGR04255 family) [Nocardioides cavernae]